jgi:hypothetical protein
VANGSVFEIADLETTPNRPQLLQILFELGAVAWGTASYCIVLDEDKGAIDDKKASRANSH